MRTSIAVPLLALTAAFVTPRVPAQAAAPVCKPARAVPPQLLTWIPGTYKLSNGDTLRVSAFSRRYVAEINRTGAFQILPLSETVFVEKGGPLRFEFSGDWPDTDVSITGLEQPRPGRQVCAPD